MALHPPSNSDLHHHEGQLSESYEEFERSCVRLSLSPSPVRLQAPLTRALTSIMEAPESSSNFSSAFDETIYTPSPSSSGGYHFDFQNVGDILINSGANVNLSPDVYAESLVISSPSDSAGYISDASAGIDGLDSPSLPQHATLNHVDQTFLRQSLTSPPWPDHMQRDASALHHEPAPSPPQATLSSISHSQYGRSGPPSRHVSNNHPTLQTQAVLPEQANEMLFSQPVAPVYQTIMPWHQEIDHGRNSIHYQSSLIAPAAQQMLSRPASMLSPYINGNDMTIYGQPNADYSNQIQGISQYNDHTLFAPSLEQVSSNTNLLSDLQPSCATRGPNLLVATRQLINGGDQSQAAGPSRSGRPVLATSSLKVHSPSSSRSSPHSISSPDSLLFKNKGGRRGGLERKARQATAEMRGNACWHCAINRERCTPGDPCDRCARMTHKSKGHELGCDRTHLKTDMMPKFITNSMDPNKIYKDIHAYVLQDMSRWHGHPKVIGGISVPFSIGIGQPLSWQCHEYEPKCSDSVHSLSWTIKGRGHPWRRTRKRSPPLAIKSLTSEQLIDWINGLVKYHIEDISDMYFWEGHQLRTEILHSLCSLYDTLRRDKSLVKGSSSEILREDLCKVISMALVTYVMNHAFTVEESVRDAVIQQLSKHDDPSLYEDMLILKTANSQLKFGFSKIRWNMHLTLLNRLQTILKHARYKEWWLSAFVIMLGLALTLEEYQHLLHVQADSSGVRGVDGATTSQEARAEARAYCAEIDTGYDFLMSLYHLKYSTRLHYEATFPYANKSSHQAEANFVNELTALFKQHHIVLNQRKDLTISSEREDDHVLRLAGRFLTKLKWGGPLGSG